MTERWCVWASRLPSGWAFADTPTMFADDGDDDTGWLPLLICDGETEAHAVADAMEGAAHGLIQEHGLVIYCNPLSDLETPDGLVARKERELTTLAMRGRIRPTLTMEGFIGPRTFLKLVRTAMELRTYARLVDGTARPVSADPGVPQGERPSCTVDEANAAAMKLAKQDAGFVHKSIREWAAEIGTATDKKCTTKIVSQTALWIATMKATGRGRTKGKTPKAVALTGKVESVIGKGDKHQVLNDLIAEQTADDDDRPGTPRKPKQYKRV